MTKFNDYNTPDTIDTLTELAVELDNNETSFADAKKAFFTELGEYGFTYENTFEEMSREKAAKESKGNTELANKARRYMTFLEVVLGSVKIGGNRLDRTDAKNIMASLPAGRKRKNMEDVIHGVKIGTVKGETTWLGQAASKVAAWSKDYKKHLEKEQGKKEKTQSTAQQRMVAKIGAAITTIRNEKNRDELSQLLGGDDLDKITKELEHLQNKFK